jgi:hypothetical protein
VNPIAFPIKLNCFLCAQFPVKFLYSKERGCESMRDFFVMLKNAHVKVMK